MEDKIIMSTLLNGVKSVCDLMMHGSIESETPNVHNTFRSALNDTLQMQNEIYAKMAQKGWYPSQSVEQTKIDQAKQKFAANK